MHKEKDALHLIFKIMYKIQTIFTSISLFSLAIMIFVQVLIRYLFKSPLFGLEEAETFLMIWVYFIGGAMASYEKTHIQCGIASVVTKNGKVLYCVDLIKDIVSSLLSLLLTCWMYDFFAYNLKKGQTSALLNIPMILSQGTFFVAMVFISIFCLRDVFDFKARREKFLGGADSCS